MPIVALAICVTELASISDMAKEARVPEPGTADFVNLADHLVANLSNLHT